MRSSARWDWSPYRQHERCGSLRHRHRRNRPDRPIPAGWPHPMLRGHIPRSRRWSVLQHSRAADDRSADETATRCGFAIGCYLMVPRLDIADLLLLNSRLPSLDQKQGHGPSQVNRQGGMTWLEWNSRAPPSMGIATFVAQRTNTLNDALAVSQNRFDGPVAYLYRSKCSFKPPSVQKRPDFSIPVLSACAEGYRSR